jgi:hypothetical protein
MLSLPFLFHIDFSSFSLKSLISSYNFFFLTMIAQHFLSVRIFLSILLLLHSCPRVLLSCVSHAPPTTKSHSSLPHFLSRYKILLSILSLSLSRVTNFIYTMSVRKRLLFTWIYLRTFFPR